MKRSTSRVNDELLVSKTSRKSSKKKLNARRLGTLAEANTPTFEQGPMLDWYRPFKILSIDGGGARGVIPLVFCQELEHRTGQPVSKLFDRIVGTSAGAIVACGLACPDSSGQPRYTATEALDMYKTLGSQVLHRGSLLTDRVVGRLEDLKNRRAAWILTHVDEVIDTLKDIYRELTNPAHDVNHMAYVLYQAFGDTKMSEALCEVFAYGYDLGARVPLIMGSTESTIPGQTRDFSNYEMYQVATASAAAVPYFAPFHMKSNPTHPDRVDTGVAGVIYTFGGNGTTTRVVDGGNGGLANPSLFGLTEPVSSFFGFPSVNPIIEREQPKIMVSMGCGHHETPVDHDSRGWGLVNWLVANQGLLNMLFDGESDVTDMVLRERFEKNVSYFRLQPNIPRDLAFLDEGDPREMERLEELARGHIAAMDEEFDRLADLST